VETGQLGVSDPRRVSEDPQEHAHLIGGPGATAAENDCDAAVWRVLDARFYPHDVPTSLIFVWQDRDDLPHRGLRAHQLGLPPDRRTTRIVMICSTLGKAF
jgi:hypothetical protein